MSFCKYCGGELRQGAAFCPECGKSTVDVSSAVPHIDDIAVPTQQSIEPEIKPPAHAAAKSAEPDKSSFLNTGLGLVLLFGILATALIAGITSPHFLSLNNLYAMLSSLAPVAMTAMGIAITSRSKGGDLSCWLVIGVSSALLVPIAEQTGDIWLALIICIGIGAVIGLINGIIAALTPLPMAPVSLALSLLLYCGWRALSLLSAPAMLSSGSSFTRLEYLTTAFALMAAAFLIAFLMCVLIKRYKKPFYLRKKAKFSFIYAAAYIVSGALAAAAGAYLVLRLKASLPFSLAPLGFADNLGKYIFIASSIYLSRAGENRFLTAPIALLSALTVAVINNAANLLQINTYVLSALYAVLAIIFTVLALALTRRSDTIISLKNRFKKEGVH